MGYWDNLNQSGWWGQVNNQSFMPAPVQQTQQPTTTTTPQTWGGWQSPAMQQMASGWNLPAQQAQAITAPKPAAPKQITPAWGVSVGGKPKFGQELQGPPYDYSKHQFWLLPQGPGLPWNKPGFNLTAPSYSASGILNPAPPPPLPKPPASTSGASGGDTPAVQYVYSSGWGSYKAPKQQSPWYMELMSWDISGA